MFYFNPNGNTARETANGIVPDAERQILRVAKVDKHPGLIKTLTLALLLLLAAFYASAGLGDEETYLYTSLYTNHYDPDPDHVNDQNMLGFENGLGNKRIWGLAMFDNSFGQESQYLYVGQKWRAFQSDRWYYKLTGGLLHGYKEPYEDKIPLNDMGVAPAIIPSIGYRTKSFFAEFSQLGLAAGMVTVGVVF